MNSKSNTIKTICEALSQGHDEEAKNILRSEYPFSFVKREKRTYTVKESMSVFVRDGFIDRYSGARLVFPGTLRLLHTLLPSEFPFHTNWKMSETHPAFWELFPTIDHIVPVSRGGSDAFENLVSTSQLRNSAKSNRLIEELGWRLFPAGDPGDWDGLTGWCLQFLSLNPQHLADRYIKSWHNTACVCPLFQSSRNHIHTDAHDIQFKSEI